MKLDRNDGPGGLGKYALINLRRCRALKGDRASEACDLLSRLDELGVIDTGARGADDEFFVVKLKDRFAAPALHAYAHAASDHDAEWATQVLALAVRAKNHPGKKTPD